MGDCSKIRTHMQLIDADGDNRHRARFSTVHDPGEQPRHQVFVDHDVWVDLGEPTELTVTIEPGHTIKG